MDQTTTARAIALVLQMTDVDEIEKVIAVAEQRRSQLTPIFVDPLPRTATWQVGDRVRINSTRNRTFHGLRGTIIKVNRQKVKIDLDPGQGRVGPIGCPFDLLERA
jgi:transcription antitermination factor NusG